jgi:hypothetical protein
VRCGVASRGGAAVQLQRLVQVSRDCRYMQRASLGRHALFRSGPPCGGDAETHITEPASEQLLRKHGQDATGISLASASVWPDLDSDTTFFVHVVQVKVCKARTQAAFLRQMAKL